MISNDTRATEQARLSGSKAALAAKPGQAGIDPRGPRFGAGITAVLLLTVIGLGLDAAAAVPATLAERATQPAFLLLTAIAVLFAWGAFAGIQRHPYGLFFKAVIRPRLSAPSHLEDPRPPTFSQGVGLAVTVLGIVLHLLAVPYALVIFAAFAFIAAFLNSVFDYCLGCQLYVLLVRAGLVGRARSAA
ncbi:DUF4395 domain-containing protein [Salinibacterium sp. NG253]|uniref:DUF4395 domain-containing protein n=1 Tax=Salinibacterium sp. NG253 TaxID=2792039 RepID=UPI0018CDC3E4|nr:DUF4395 domain-containing protein [Salinibacterium sp. NG253]MBH0115263.1 DUF4395 domain-containing protein [Salinibacterium sp. NG253]